MAYPWTNLMWYAAAPEHRPRWLGVDLLLGGHGIQRDNAPGRQQFERRLEAPRLEEGGEEQGRVLNGNNYLQKTPDPRRPDYRSIFSSTPCPGASHTYSPSKRISDPL